MMKKCKILGTAAAMMLVFALAGCENNTDDVDALKKRVDQMEQELADMEINNNLAESSQDKASINEVSASDDSIASLTQAVDDMVSKANEAKPDGIDTEGGGSREVIFLGTHPGEDDTWEGKCRR